MGTAVIVRTFLLALVPATVGAGDTVDPTLPEKAEDDLRRWELFPREHLYPAYIADPARPTFAVRLVRATTVTVPESGRNRFALSMGGQFPIARYRFAETGWTWQFQMDAGFYGQFDLEHGTDNLGWDGIYGFLLTGSGERGPALRFGMRHYSSHLGDEYIERTGRTRLSYTREETVVGLSWSFARHWRAYGEAAWGHLLRTTAIQDPWRFQLGLEHERPLGPFHLGGSQRPWGWFAATHTNLMEERKWRLDFWLKAGVYFPAGPRRWRFGAGYSSGRVPIGEFSLLTEDSLFLGVWLDL